MQVATSPDNSFIVLLRLFVPCGECMSQLRMMSLTTDTLCPAGVFVKANTQKKYQHPLLKLVLLQCKNTLLQVIALF